MEKEERQPEDAGIADIDTKMYLLKYCFGRPALLLTQRELSVYLQMMKAVNQGPHDITPF